MNTKIAVKVFRVLVILAFLLGTTWMPSSTAGAQEPIPTFTARLTENRINDLWGWPDGAVFALSIDHPDTPQSPDYETEFSDYIDGTDLGDFKLQIGDLVIVTDGYTTKSTIVANVSITEVNIEKETISGTADPFTNLSVRIRIAGVSRLVQADATGNWLADFSVPGTPDADYSVPGVQDGGQPYDIQPGNNGVVRIEDDDGDITTERWRVPNPTFDIIPNLWEVEVWGWPLDVAVTLNIDDPRNGPGVDYTDTQFAFVPEWDSNGSYIRFFFRGLFDAYPGFIVTLSDGSITKEHIVTNHVVTSVDPLTDQVSGTAEPGSKLIAEICNESGCTVVNVTTDENGDWTADFTGVYDIVPGTNGGVRQFDEDGDGTGYHWNLPNPFIEVRANRDRIEGYEWPEGTTVTIEIDDPDTLVVNPDYSNTVTVGTAPWDPTQIYFELRLWGVIDIQPGFIVTATDGVTTRQHTVVNLEITDIDIDADIATGTAVPDGQIDIWACEFNNCFNIDGVPVDGSGNWSANFHGIHDIQPGTWIDSIQRDEQGNGTLFGQTVEGAEIAGTIYALENVPGNEAGGVMVEACNTDQSVCRNALTDESGRYTIAYLPKGEFDLKAYPAGDELPGYSDQLINITEYITYYADAIVLPGTPTPPPSGAIEPSREGGGTISVYIGDELTLTANGCPGGTASFELTVLDDGYTRTGAMNETPIGSGIYKITTPPLAPHHGVAEIVYTISCPDGSSEVTPFFIYIDPSGVVVTTSGIPIAGATVTLYRSDNPDGPFEVVPAGSVLMSPSNRTNPDITDKYGKYGWDVLAGFYKVRAEKDGCFSPTDPSQAFVESAVLTIPPPVTDLELILECSSPPTDVVITAPVNPSQITDFIAVQVDFADPNENDNHTIMIEWGDTTNTKITLTGHSAIFVHQYQSAGVYMIDVTVTDSVGGTAHATYQYVVIFDPNSGFVTGGGWIWSPEGAYIPEPSLTGKATFGFVSKYLKGTNVPSGSTEFQFKVANLNFKSTSYDWLVIAGSKAQFKGIGTINGVGEYKFMLTAIDGSPDKFRIKIWEAETGNVIYDNQLGVPDAADPSTTIQGGSIVIHKAK